MCNKKIYNPVDRDMKMVWLMLNDKNLYIYNSIKNEEFSKRNN